MLYKKTLLLGFVLISQFVFSQNQLWTPLNAKSLSLKSTSERKSNPKKFQLFSLDVVQLKALLKECHSDRVQNKKASSTIIPIPDANGDMHMFSLKETETLHPDLAQKFPGLKTYAGSDENGNYIKLSHTVFGLHAQIFSNEGTTYIDPTDSIADKYMVYARKDLVKKVPFTCLAKNASQSISNEETSEPFVNTSQKAALSDGKFRTYRMAMASTVEYSNFHIRRANKQFGSLQEKQEAVLSAMTVTLNRVNGVFERDFAVNMQLVPNNTEIIFIGTDNLTNDDGGKLLDQIQPVIDQSIGFSNYDIGHVVSTGGGGVAILGSVCSSEKAKGVTGLDLPVGDPFDIDFVAHEIGHQFGAFHTFSNFCKGNISYSTAYEPSSGSTLMAYAGVCGDRDDKNYPELEVQLKSDDYFHAASVDQIITFINSINGCGQIEILNNTVPVAIAGNDYKIPHSTPFRLKGNAIDDDSTLTFCWEQYDKAKTETSPMSQSTIGPMFRSLPPTDNPTRFFPVYSDVLSGKMGNKWEVLPSVSRSMNFKLTVRDNNPQGGQIGQDMMRVNVSNNGPFRLTSQNIAGEKWSHDRIKIITWDIGGTDGNGINTATVNIKLSIDGGENYDYTLAENVANDGLHDIRVPKVYGNNCRILIEPTDNIYYAINSAPITIGSGEDDSNDFVLYNTSPAKESLVFQYLPNSREPIEVFIFDSLGIMIFSQKYSSINLVNESISLANLQSGLYIFHLIDSGQKKTKKFMVMQ